MKKRLLGGLLASRCPGLGFLVSVGLGSQCEYIYILLIYNITGLRWWSFPLAARIRGLGPNMSFKEPTLCFTSFSLGLRDQKQFVSKNTMCKRQGDDSQPLASCQTLKILKITYLSRSNCNMQQSRWFPIRIEGLLQCQCLYNYKTRPTCVTCAVLLLNLDKHVRTALSSSRLHHLGCLGLPATVRTACW